MDPADQLEQALAAAALALEAGDPAAAEEASGRAAEASAQLERSGAGLEPARLARCAALQARCEAAAGQVQRRLLAELGAASRSTRANTAYRGG